jgi:D-arabinose 1-dehydrogenase-like Zn-dependent alcohol dehydrogenase
VVTEDDVRDGIAEVANGCFNSFQVIKDWQQVVRLPREIPAQVGCLLPCSGLRAYVALLDARPCFDQAVRVRGFANLLIVAGDSVDGLELWCIQLLKTVFCNRNVKVVCASGRRDRADLAIRAGADDAVLLPAGSTTSQLVDATTMSGYNRMDVSIDLQGDARSFTVALRSLHRGGTLIELGTGSAESAASVQVPPLAELVARSVTLIGVKSGSLVQLRQLVDVLAVQRNVGVDDVPVELYSPAQLDSAVQRTKRHLANGHVIIKYD